MKSNQLSALLLGFVGASLAIVAQNHWGIVPVSLNNASNQNEAAPIVRTARPIQPVYTANGLALDFTAAASASVDAVVHVKTQTAQAVRLNPWLEMLGYGAAPSIAQGSGSGVIVAADGFIVTNNHVIDGADAIEVSLNDNRIYSASVVGTDPATDLALLKISADEPLPIIPFGNSEEMEVGEWVLAVGNPFDLTSTVTAGIVSAKARNINILRGDARRDIFPIESFIQTDAAVNPGNSGGALVNAAGELVGINTAIASKTGSYSGYSFAVPSSIVRKVSEDLMAYGRVQRAFLGVRVGEVDQAIANELGLDRIEGVYVANVTDAGGAEAAGMQPGDIILEIEGMAVNSLPELQENVSKYRPGEHVEVLCLRGGQLKSVNIELRDAAGSTRIVDRSEAEWFEALGARLSSVASESDSDEAIGHGVEVTDIRQGRFLEAGIREGFLITRIDGRMVTTPEEVISAFANAQGGVLVEGVYRNGKRAYYGVAAQK